MRVKVAGVWKTSTPHMRVAGVWKKCSVGWVRAAGVWKKFFEDVAFAARFSSTITVGTYTDQYGSNRGYASSALFGQTFGAASPATVGGYTFGGLYENLTNGVYAWSMAMIGNSTGLGIVQVNVPGFGIITVNGTYDSKFNWTLYAVTAWPAGQNDATLFAFLNARIGQAIAVQFK